ncbi:hypothetical protein BT69DRAFT_1005521 [Atractiella rhizophila]|nr:hypothetical protein BT69DRAFT_1005521 [Atractiella rhizophila]
MTTWDALFRQFPSASTPSTPPPPTPHPTTLLPSHLTSHFPPTSLHPSTLITCPECLRTVTQEAWTPHVSACRKWRNLVAKGKKKAEEAKASASSVPPSAVAGDSAAAGGEVVWRIVRRRVQWMR